MRRHTPFVLALTVLMACDRPAAEPPVASPIKMTGPLIAASMSMKAAWEYPRNPLTDKTLDNSKLADEVRRGFKLFSNTPAEAPRLAPGGMSCTNCHMNAGQRERSMPLVDVAGMFPEYNRRSGRLYSLGDRITDCFLRSENATGGQLAADQLPNPSSPEVLAISAYLTWLARGAEVGKNPSWRGQNTIPASALVPVEKLDTAKGEAIYVDRCATCHGADGQGSWRAALFLVRPGKLSDAAALGARSDQYLFDLIKNGGAPIGRPGMPAFGSTLTESDIRELVTYVRGLSHPR